MADDTNQNNNSTIPSSLIGKRFGGFRNDMVRMGEDNPTSQPVATTQDLTKQPTSSEMDRDEYKKIIDTRSIDEIEAENEKLEKIFAPDQELRPEKELQTGEELEITAPDKETELSTAEAELEINMPEVKVVLNTQEPELEIESPEKLKELDASFEELEIEAPEIQIELETEQTPEIELPNESSQQNLQEKKDEIYESDDRNIKTKIDDPPEPNNIEHKYDVTVMPPKDKFQFKRLEWYWHIVKRPSLGLALFMVIIYSLRTLSVELPNVVWFALNILTFAFAVYVIFVIVWQVVRVRHEYRSQAIVAGFCAGASVGLVLAFFRIVYVFKIWTLYNIIVEPITIGILGGLVAGLFSLLFKRKPYNS